MEFIIVVKFRFSGQESGFVQRRSDAAGARHQQQVREDAVRRRHFDGLGDAQEGAHAVGPVQEVAGFAHAHPQRLPALLRPLRQTQRTQKAQGTHILLPPTSRCCPSSLLEGC